MFCLRQAYKMLKAQVQKTVDILNLQKTKYALAYEASTIQTHPQTLILFLSLSLDISGEAEVDKWKTNRAVSTLNGGPTLSWLRSQHQHEHTHTLTHHTDQSVISWPM